MTQKGRLVSAWLLLLTGCGVPDPAAKQQPGDGGQVATNTSGVGGALPTTTINSSTTSSSSSGAVTTGALSTNSTSGVGGSASTGTTSSAGGAAAVAVTTGGTNTTSSSGTTGGEVLAPYLPFVVGARWVYAASDSSGRSGQTESVVEALEDVGGDKAGTMGYRVRSTLLSGGSTVNWQQETGSAVVRHRAQFLEPNGVVRSEYVYVPFRLRLDEEASHLITGATWSEDHTATVNNGAASASYSVTWTVEASDESVTVPAGTFSCLRVRRVQSGYSSSDETHWFARGVGKVREIGVENKDLVSYTIP